MKLEPGQTIAVVGLSAKTDRPSFEVAHAMQRAGFRMIPVNPQYAGSQILGETCVATLAEITEHVDIVDCFRKSEDMVEVARAAVAMRELPKVLWMQQGVANAEARSIAEAAGIEVVEDQCIKIAYYSQR
ncbi:MAG: CoA-binding protein [Casimicrobium sp.]